MAAFAESVVDDDQAGKWVGPPPAKGAVGDEPEQDRGGEVGVDEGDAAFGLEDAVAECLAGVGFAGGGASMRTQVAEVQAIPRLECSGRLALISV